MEGTVYHRVGRLSHRFDYSAGIQLGAPSFALLPSANYLLAVVFKRLGDGSVRQINKTFVPPVRENIGFGHQIRSYVQDAGYVKDLRTGVTRQFDSTIDGDLDDFLRESLRAGLGNPRGPCAVIAERDEQATPAG